MPFPQPPILDDFERANEDPVSQGGQWNTSGTNIVGQTRLRVSGGDLDAGATAGTRSSFRIADMGPDVAMSLQVPSIPDNTGNLKLWLAFDVDADPTTPNGYGVRVVGTATSLDWNIMRWDASVEVVLVSSIGYGLDVNDNVGFVRRGDTLEAWHSLEATPTTWVQVLSTTDSTYSGQIGKLVVSLRRTFVEVDNLGGSTLEEFITQIYRRTRG